LRTYTKSRLMRSIGIKNKGKKGKLERNIVPILKVGVDSRTKEEVLTSIWGYLQARGVKKFQAQIKPIYIITPNPEIVYRASNDPNYAQVLNTSALSAPDGIGLAWAVRIAKLKLPQSALKYPYLFTAGISQGFLALKNARKELVPGRVLFDDLVAMAAKEKLRVFLLGGRAMVAEKTASKLQRRGIDVAWASGPWLNLDGDPASSLDQALEIETIKKINEFKPNLLFVAFGPPKQEFWINKNIKSLEIGLAVGVGGTFDYYSGERPLPPKILSDFGLEWFWRLITQPWRAGRIFKAVVLFPLKVFSWKLQNS
jgi:N-acetylglucosaminyldiphosphoundecaprenol N-acetyl-beta-D-mannosaminyltransferase